MQIPPGRVVCVAAVLSLAAALTARAQDSYRQTVVVTAAATPVALGDATRITTVISRQEIAALPVYSIADVLRLIASVDVRARGERGVQSDFSIRGAGFGQMLVLVDGVRLNDPQSGHHNGDIPVPLDAVERIEVLQGAGSSLFGADAFGGTINVITRQGVDAPRLTVHGGSFGAAGAAARIGLSQGMVTQTFAGAFDRSDGFMYDRDFSTAIVRSRTDVGETSSLSLSILRKEFGANNFYGGNAPSREWTNQTLLGAAHHDAVGAWRIAIDGSYRTHGDRFVFNQVTPALSDNRHRTHALLGKVIASRRVAAATVAAGVDGGGEWIRSTNLGDHDLSRVSGFGEWRQPLGQRGQLAASVRADRYSEFGTSWSPSLGASWWVAPSMRLRVSGGRAFRVPTFTERYYSDPANLARADVQPESAWAGEAGADLVLTHGVLLQGTVFRRAERDVIDWLRPTAVDRWQTYNIRDVETRGLELALQKRFRNGAFVLAELAALDVDAPAVTQLSKYALDYASRSLVAAGSLPLPGRLRVSSRIEYRRRVRSLGREEYVVVDARIGRRVGSWLDVHVDGTNLLDRSYHEVAGVPMPGAAMTLSVGIGR